MWCMYDAKVTSDEMLPANHGTLFYLKAKFSKEKKAFVLHLARR